MKRNIAFAQYDSAAALELVSRCTPRIRICATPDCGRQAAADLRFCRTCQGHIELFAHTNELRQARSERWDRRLKTFFEFWHVVGELEQKHGWIGGAILFVFCMSWIAYDLGWVLLGGN